MSNKTLLLVPAALVAAALLSFLCVTPTAAQEKKDDDWKDAVARYGKSESRPSLIKRTTPIFVLAETKDVRAVDILKTRYDNKREKEPARPVKHLVADAIGRELGAPATAKKLAEWTEKIKLPDDAWLAYNTTLASAGHGQFDDLAKYLMTKKHKPQIRAALIEALAEKAPDPSVLPPMLATQLDENVKPKTKPAERYLILTAVASALNSLYERNPELLDDAAFQKCCLKLVDLAFGAEVEEETKLTCARYLAMTYQTGRVDITQPFWAKVIEDRGDKSAPEERQGRKTRSAFVGLEGRGKHVVFLIDMSSSMEEFMPRRRSRVIDTAREPEDVELDEEGNEVKKKEPEKDPADSIDWSKVKTRMDLAKIMLATSLENLEEDTSFCVVYFGSKASYLEGFSGLVPATKENVSKAIKAINELSFPVANVQKGDNPDDFIRETNIHGAFLLGYRALAAKKGKGAGEVLKDNEHVEDEAFLRGADTVYLLSDGNPTMDDYSGDDTSEADDRVVGRESDEEKGRSTAGEWSTYYGPYRQPYYLLRDIDRINLFRKAEIHCVGIGEVDVSLLVRIAWSGRGKVRMFAK